ncbi:MAG TPA: hypothetical protein LFV91_04005 [Rickettsia endosymbiont of Bembidion nr. Transversale]|nr:hypothetical protein [Rickettsia endosymbiont of Bembidion nr. Transversale]
MKGNTYTVQIWGFTPDFITNHLRKPYYIDLQQKLEPFCILGNTFYGLTFLPISRNLLTMRDLFEKLDIVTSNLVEKLPIMNLLINDALAQWVEARAVDGNIVSIHYATLQEIKELKNLVEGNKVKLSCHDKTETLELLSEYETSLYPDSIKMIGENDNI